MFDKLLRNLWHKEELDVRVCWMQWKNFTKERKQLRNVIQKVVIHHVQPNVGGAFWTWRLRVCQIREGELKQRIESLNDVSVKHFYRQIVGRKVLQAWRIATNERLVKKRFLNHITEQAKVRTIRMGWILWREFTATKVYEEQLANEKKLYETSLSNESVEMTQRVKELKEKEIVAIMRY